jgi:hypothetical protein
MDRKMAAAGEREIQPQDETTKNSRSSLEKLQARQELVRGEVLKFYISFRREIPEATMMDAEVSVAMEDWQDIPSIRLPEVCAEARKQAQGFIPSNSAVITAWAQIRHAEIRAARESDAAAAAATITPKRTQEEVEFIESFFANIRECLGKGLRPMDWHP